MRTTRKLDKRLTRWINVVRRRKLRLFWVVCLVVTLGLVSAALTTMVLNGLIGEGFLSWPTAASLPSERLDVVKVALLVAGGIGGAVALTVSYRKQKWAEEDIAGKRTAYTAAATQLGDPSPTVRLAGVYALANLADDWPEQRQQCVDVLCGHLRVPWTHAPLQDEDAPAEEPPTTPEDNRGEEQVRTTILTVIADHLHPAEHLHPGAHSWSTLHLNLTAAAIPGWELDGCLFTGHLSAQSLALLPDQQISLIEADLIGADLVGAVLTGADLTGADLTGADLTGADLTGAILSDTILTRAIVHDADLTGAIVHDADLIGAWLTGANLTGADLTGADLTGANLTDARLNDADLTWATLKEARLKGAHLTGAKLTQARLSGANLEGANLTVEDVIGTIRLDGDLPTT